MRTNVSEERITSIFGVKNQPGKKPVCSRWLGRWFMYGLQGTMHQKIATFK
jgi:hypothetical protein